MSCFQHMAHGYFVFPDHGIALSLPLNSLHLHDRPDSACDLMPHMNDATWEYPSASFYICKQMESITKSFDVGVNKVVS